MKFIQNIILEKYLLFFNKKIEDLEPRDALLLNEVLYKGITSHFFSEQENTFFLFENENYSYILNNNLSENERRNDFYSCFLEPGSNPEYGLALPIEEYKYSTCEYMTEDEFDDYERSIKNKTFYSLEELNKEQKIVLSKKDLDSVMKVMDSLENLEKIPDDAKPLLKSIVSFFPEQGYEKKKILFSAIEGNEAEFNKNALQFRHNEFFHYAINEKGIVNNDYVIYKIKNKYNEPSDNPEKILKRIQDDPLFQDFKKNYKENKIKSILSKRLNSEILSIKQELYSEIKEKTKSLINFEKDFETSFKEKKLNDFIDFLTQDIALKKIFTEDSLEKNVVKEQLKDFEIKYLEVNHDFFKNIDDFFNIQFDTLGDIYSSNNMNIIKSPDYDESLKNKTFQFIAHNENQIVGGINMISGEYYQHQEYDYVMTGIATSNKFRNLKIAENLFRKALDFCVENNKNMVRTKPTIDGNKKIYDKFTKIANEEKYSSIIVVDSSEEYPYRYLQEKISQSGGNKENLDKIFRKVREVKEKDGEYPKNDVINALIDKELNQQKRQKNKVKNR